MTIYSLFFMLLLSAIPVSNTSEIRTEPAEVVTPRNIILMIGDGMGISQISAAMYVNGNKTNLEKFPVVGLHKAIAADGLITDSAAGSTALACGVRTYTGAIGVNQDTMPMMSILEEAEARGMATGLVTTSSITDATPAAFIAHVKLRNQVEDIAASFLNTEIDFLVGGGENALTRRKTDNRNLRLELEQKGYFVSGYKEQALTDIVPVTQQNFAYFTAEEEPLSAAKGRNYLPLASNMATYFLNKRSGEKGFFLMVEGAQIEWGGHEKNSEYIISEMTDFEKAISEVLKFAERDGETLVIVTADHETGGYAINPGSTVDSLIPAFSTDQATGSLIPVFAYGPGAEYFRGIYDNTSIYARMRKSMGWASRASN